MAFALSTVSDRQIRWLVPDCRSTSSLLSRFRTTDSRGRGLRAALFRKSLASSALGLDK